MSLPDRALVEVLRARAYDRRTVRLAPETALRLAAALWSTMGGDRIPPRQHKPEPASLGFIVEQMSDDGTKRESLVAAAAHFDIARAAYDEALKHYPHRRIVFRQGAQLVRDSGRPDHGKRG